MAKNFKFNLLKKKGGSIFSDLGLFFNPYAKYMIIITQLLVLSVFLIKIVLDQKIIDLKEAIDQKNQIILASQTMTQSNNLLLDKIQQIDIILKKINADYKTLSTILTNIPQSVTIKRISLQKQKLILLAQTYEAKDIQKLQKRIEKKLQKQAKLQKIEKEANVYYFEISVSQ